MPNIIDNRVVEMQFNNKQFEQGVSASMGTLEKLKNALNFSSSVSNFGDVTKAFSRFGDSTLSNISANVQALSDRFSTWGIVGMQVIQDLTSKATEFVSQALKPITDELSKLDVLTNYSQGWTKYADKTTAVQTIMSATATTWEDDAKAMGDAGTQMEYVSSALEKLNWFSDETSYSFTDMTNNIGKFTAQGVPLSQAVEAMEGISVWAAKSGQGTNEAARAMYNLSQALGTGSVKLMDWRSIENANMGTLEFKNTVLETAVAAGTLTKAIDKEGKVLYKTASGLEVTASNFSQTLSEGWFSKDVLLSTLSKYGNATTLLADISSEYEVTASQFISSFNKFNRASDKSSALSKAADELGISAEELSKIFDTLNSDEYALGLASFKMAQEAKTFSEAMSATADATSTAWMNVFESIFGNYEEAKELWTELANDLWTVFAGPVSGLSDVFAEWKELGGRDLFFGMEEGNYGAIIRLFDELESVGSVVADTFHSLGLFTLTGEGLFEKTAEFKRSIEIFFKFKWEKVLATIEGITKAAGAGVYVFKNLLDAISNPFRKFGKEVIGNLWGDFDPVEVFGKIEKALWGITSYINGTLKPILDDLIYPVLDDIYVIADVVEDLFGTASRSLGPIAKTLINSVHDFGVELRWNFASFGGFFDTILGLVNGLEGLVYAVGRTEDGLSKLEIISGALASFFAELWGLGLDVLGYLGDMLAHIINEVQALWKQLDASRVEELLSRLSAFRNTFNNLLTPVFEGLRTFITSIRNLIVSIINSGVLTTIVDFIRQIADAGAKTIGGGIKDFFELLASGADKLAENMPAIAEFLKSHLPNLSNGLSKLGEGFKSIFDSIKGLGEKIIGIFDKKEGKSVGLFGQAIDAIGKAFAWLGSVLQNIGPIASSVLGWLFDKIANIGPTIINVLKKIGSGIGFVVEKVKELFGGSGFSLEKILKLFNNGALGVLLVQLIKAFGSGGLGGIFSTLSGLLKGKGFKELFSGAGEGIQSLIDPLKTLFGGGEKSGLDAKTIKSIATSILMVAASCLILASIDSDKMTSALFGLAGAMTEIAAAFALLNNFSGTTDPKKGALSNFFNSLTLKNNRNSSGSMLLKMTASLLIVAGALKVLSTMNWDQIDVALTAMAGSLALMVAAMLIMELAENTKSSGAGLMTAALGMIALALALKIFGSMNQEKISNGLKAFLGSLLLLTAALVILGGVGPAVLAGAGALLIGAAAMVVMAGALAAFGVVLGLLSILKWDKISESLKPLAGIMLAIIGIGALMGVASPLILLGALSVAALGAALIALGKGLLVYSVALVVLNKLSGGIGALAGSLAVLSAMSLVLAIVSPLFLVAAVGMLAFGAALKTLGVGLLIFSAAMAAFSLSIDVILASLKLIILGFIWMIPELFAAIVVGLINMFVTIAENASLIAETIITIATAILSKLGELVPLIVDLVLNLVVQLLEKLKEVVPLFLELVFDTLTQIVYGLADFAADVVVALLQLLTDTLTALAEFVPQIIEQSVKIALGFIEGFLKGLADGIPGIIQASWDLVIAFVDGIADGIDNNWDRLMEAFRHLGKSLINAIFGIFVSKETKDDMEESGTTIIDQIIEGFVAKYKEFKEQIGNLIGKIGEWLKEKWDEIKNVGGNIINGFVEGIGEKAGELARKAKEVVDNVVGSVKRWLGINSPSRVFTEIGEFSILGLAKGLSDNTKLATDSAEDVGINVSNALSQALQNASASVEDVSPVITPIVDMSNVNDSSRQIAGMFGGVASGMIGLSGSARLAALSSINAEQLGAYPANSAYSVGTINFTINPQPGQNPEEIADEVMNRLNTTLLRGKAAWA